MKTKFSKKLFPIALLLLLVLICIYLFLHSSIFDIAKVKVSDNHSVTQDEILALAGISKGTNIFQLDQELTRRSVRMHPMVKDAQIIRHLPSTIEIKIKERQSWAVIPYDDEFLLVDSDGICIDKLNELPDQNIPIITMDKVPDRVNLGQAAAPEAVTMVRKVWQALGSEDRQKISQFHYLNKDKSLLIFTLDGTEIRFGNLDRLQEKATRFHEAITIEANFKKVGKEVLDYVDLRFKGQPVVKTRT